MSGFKGIMKDGWHPKGRDGGKESWRGDFKGINQVAGWMGKGRDPNEKKEDHISRPLAALKDPSSFGPPPKNVNYHGGAALPDRITPDTRGWGAPLTQAQIESAQQATSPVTEEAEPSKPAPPPVPYRANTTGLNTSHLPPPPTHRAVAEMNAQKVESPPASKPKPSLPPRLPSRTPTIPADPPPAYEPEPLPLQSPSPVSLPPPVSPPVASASNGDHSYFNGGAINRLGKAGVSVPALGIGEQQNPWQGERSQSGPVSNGNSGHGGQLSELQQRFAKMNASSNQSEASVSSPAQSTTLAEKQQAVQTAQNFHRDPSSVSPQDAKQAVSTANSFRERHSEQIKAASSKASEFNKKYNITGRVNSYFKEPASTGTEQQPQPGMAQSPAQGAAYAPSQSPEAHALSNRKPPPPPPPKKPANMSTHPNASGVQMPPPVPLGTKPR